MTFPLLLESKINLGVRSSVELISRLVRVDLGHVRPLNKLDGDPKDQAHANRDHCMVVSPKQRNLSSDVEPMVRESAKHEIRTIAVQRLEPDSIAQECHCCADVLRVAHVPERPRCDLQLTKMLPMIDLTNWRGKGHSPALA